jgi:hypothetical protein
MPYPTPTVPQPETETIMNWFWSVKVEATDGCMVEPDGVCEHNYPSWLIHLNIGFHKDGVDMTNGRNSDKEPTLEDVYQRYFRGDNPHQGETEDLLRLFRHLQALEDMLELSAYELVRRAVIQDQEQIRSVLQIRNVEVYRKVPHRGSKR